MNGDLRNVELLIVGGESDPNTQRIVDQAHFRGIDYFFHDTDLASPERIAWDLSTPALDLRDFRVLPKSIFARCNVFSSSDSICTQVHESIQAYALGWPEIRILNRRSLANRNVKAENLKRAIELKMAIPETLILGELSPLATLPDPDQWILKPLNGGTMTVLARQYLAEPTIAIANYGPWFLQRRLFGENLRIFVIGGESFCFHLSTSALDYRSDARVQVSQVQVPETLAGPSKLLAEQIGFDYCALDFRCCHGFDSPQFLEINSFPMFVRFDDAGMNCLANRMLDFLVRKNPTVQ